MTTHKLKCDMDFFDDIWHGRKTYEYRLNDRDFKVGDTLKLMDYQPYEMKYSGQFVLAKVVHILKGGLFGIPAGYCIMVIKNIATGSGEELGPPCVACPFCDETGFDLLGLKMHIINAWCAVFGKLPSSYK